MTVTQERVACPFTCTVHAPQRPTPQPNFDPVSPKMSRRYQSRGISGSPLKDCSAPFTFSWIIFRFPQPRHSREINSTLLSRLFRQMDLPILCGTQMSLLFHLQNYG